MHYSHEYIAVIFKDKEIQTYFQESKKGPFFVFLENPKHFIWSNYHNVSMENCYHFH